MKDTCFKNEYFRRQCNEPRLSTDTKPPKNAPFEIDVRIEAFYVAGARCDTQVCAKYPDLAYAKKNNDALEALYRSSFDMREETNIK